VASKQIAVEVIGTDPSGETLARAPKDPRIRYARASAEKLTFAEGSFHMIIALAFHWFDRVRFLA
jgi:ubiquinone/menaquinone biosynthesis C-methylase UbiE